MNNFSKIGIEELRYLVGYILENKNNARELIKSFGKATSGNGQGTVFLTPWDPIFKVIWINEKDNEVRAVGLGGPAWELKISDFLSVYKNYTEGFERYENEFFYVFFLDENYSHTIKIYSKDRVIEQKILLNDEYVNAIEIHLK